MLFQKSIVITEISYLHSCLLETFCYLADENSPAVQQLMQIIQQPPLTTQGDPLSHPMYTFSAVPVALLLMTASLDHHHMILSFAVSPQAESKIASSKKYSYEMRNLPARAS